MSPDLVRVAQLERRLQELHSRTAETPLFNPVFQLGLELSRQLESGELSLDAVDSLVAELECDGLRARAARLNRLLTPVGPEANEASLRAWQPDHAAIGALAQASDSMGLCVFARSVQADYQLVVRAFPAGVGVVEDPASGAANGLIAAYIAHAEPHGLLSHGYRVSQGREVGHDARLVARIDGMATWIGGRSHTVVDGSLDWIMRDVSAAHVVEASAERLARLG